MNPKFALHGLGSVLICVALSAAAAPPIGPTTNYIVKLDGAALASPPQSGRVLAPTFHYAGATKTLHMWVLMAGAPGESLTNIRHATSTDGINFTSAGNLSYAGDPWSGTPWGTQTGEPAMVYPKIAQWNGRYKLLTWTYNAQAGQGPWGDYNYNVSVNDIGTSLDNLVVQHEGPVGPIAGGIPGQTAGAWGVVDDVLYFENNFFIGRSVVTELPPGDPFTPPATQFTGPYRLNGSATAVMDMVHPLPAPFAPALNCFDVGTPKYYVHNDARVLKNPDGTLGVLYSIRDCTTASRVAPQLWYAESTDGGANWGNPAGIFSGAPVIVQAVETTGNFSVADFFVADGERYVYFSTTDADGNYVVVGSGLPIPAILQSAASRRVHGAAGAFDLPLSLVSTDPATEPRLGPNATIVFTFDKAITSATASVTEGTATAGSVTYSGNEVVVALGSVANLQYVSVSLTAVTSADGATGGTASVRVGFLAGDVTGNRVVTVADLGLINAGLAQFASATNFLLDVNASGVLTVADKALANAALTTILPLP